MRDISGASRVRSCGHGREARDEHGAQRSTGVEEDVDGAEDADHASERSTTGRRAWREGRDASRSRMVGVDRKRADKGPRRHLIGDADAAKGQRGRPVRLSGGDHARPSTFAEEHRHALACVAE